MISSGLLLEWSIGTGVKQVKPVTGSFSASCNSSCISMNCAHVHSFAVILYMRAHVHNVHAHSARGGRRLRTLHAIVASPGPPSGRRVLAGPPVHRFPEQVGVPGVPAVLLDQVAHEPAEAGLDAVRPGGMDKLAGPAVSQGRAEPAAGALDGVVPERVELLWRIVRGGGELPLIVAAVKAEGIPGRAHGLP